jgi:hypothetical protein
MMLPCAELLVSDGRLFKLFDATPGSVSFASAAFVPQKTSLSSFLIVGR